MYLDYFLFHWKPWPPITITGCHQKRNFLFILLRSNPYISNLYILDQNPRLSSHIIGVKSSDYISLILICGDLPLTLKTGEFWNLLESTPSRIPLIEPSIELTWILLIISNSKLGIWIRSQPIIDVNSQSNLYDVLTLDHTRLYTPQYTNYILGTYSTSSSSIMHMCITYFWVNKSHLLFFLRIKVCDLWKTSLFVSWG